MIVQGYCTDIGDIVPSWDNEGRELASVHRYQRGTIFTHISVITLLLYNYNYFVPSAVVCNLKNEVFL